MSRRSQPITIADYERLSGQKLTPQPKDQRTGSRRVGGRYVQRGTAGKRPALNNEFFRSRYEANMALYFRWINVSYQYEPKRFEFPGIKGRNASILLDFYLPSLNKYIEVKGWLDNDSRIRLARMRKYYPLIRVEVIGASFFREICRQRVCKMIPAYECRHTGYA